MGLSKANIQTTSSEEFKQKTVDAKKLEYDINMGHTDIATTTIYLHSDREQEKAAAVKTGNALLKKPKRYTITNKAKKIEQKSKKDRKLISHLFGTF